MCVCPGGGCTLYVTWLRDHSCHFFLEGYRGGRTPHRLATHLQPGIPVCSSMNQLPHLFTTMQQQIPPTAATHFWTPRTCVAVGVAHPGMFADKLPANFPLSSEGSDAADPIPSSTSSSHCPRTPDTRKSLSHMPTHPLSVYTHKLRECIVCQHTPELQWVLPSQGCWPTSCLQASH